MKYKLEKTIIFFIILVTLITNIVPVLAISFNDNQIINLQKDHECFSLLKVQGKDMLKMVEYVVYIDPTTGEKQPAFCVEPNKEGIGTGAGENYDVTLKLSRADASVQFCRIPFQQPRRAGILHGCILHLR